MVELEGLALKVAVEVRFAPAVSTTGFGLYVMVSPGGREVPVDKVTLPEKPFRLVRTTVEVPVVAELKLREGGFTENAKS